MTGRIEANAMNEKERSYLLRCRDLMQKRNHINSQVRGFAAICSALKDWQITTEYLGSVSNSAILQEWSDDQLGKLTSLRTDIIVFHRMTRELTKIWGQMNPEEKIGMAEPSTLRLPT